MRKTNKQLIEIEDLAVDFEIADRNVSKKEIVSLSIVRVKDKQIIYDKYLKPSNPFMSPFKQGQGMTPERMAAAPTIEEESALLQQVMKHSNIILWGLEKDLETFPQLQTWAHSSECGCVRFSDRFGSYHPYFKNHTRVGLSAACESIGYKNYALTKHTSLGDSLALCEVVNWMNRQDLPRASCPTDMVPMQQLNLALEEIDSLKEKLETKVEYLEEQELEGELISNNEDIPF